MTTRTDARRFQQVCRCRKGAGHRSRASKVIGVRYRLRGGHADERVLEWHGIEALTDGNVDRRSPFIFHSTHPEMKVIILPEGLSGPVK